MKEESHDAAQSKKKGGNKGTLSDPQEARWMDIRLALEGYMQEW